MTLIIINGRICYMKKKWLTLIILLVVCAIVCGYIFFNRTDNAKITIDNQTHDLKDINEVVELAKKEFHNEGIKAKLLSVEYHEKDVMNLEEELKNEFSTTEAVVINIKFKTFLITNQSLNKNEVYTDSMHFIKKDNSWSMVNYGQG